MRLNSPKRLLNHATTEGNMTVLVLVDTAKVDFPLQQEILFSCLSHFGIPYELFDLGYEELKYETLREHRAVVIAQENIGPCLSNSEMEALVRAVREGLGLLNFDNALQAYGEVYRTLLGVQYKTLGDRIQFEGCREVIINRCDHYITQAQEVGAEHRLKMPLSVLVVSSTEARVEMLAETRTKNPIILATIYGQGRVVQFLIPPRIWLDQYLGHLHGLDDVFWKSIVWVAKKPFVMKAWPPMVAMRVDDEGFIKKPGDLAFLQIGSEFGWKIHLGLAIRSVPAECYEKIKKISDVGKAEIVAHAFDRENGLFNVLNVRDYTKQEMKDAASEIDAFFERIGIAPSKVINNHEWGWGRSALAYMKSRGMNYGLNPNLPCEHSVRELTDWQPYPYGSFDVFYDYLPQDHDIMMLRSHPEQEYLRVYLPNGKFVWYDARIQEEVYDFMKGKTIADGKESNDINAIAVKMARQIKFLTENLFWAGLITHTTTTTRLSPSEWRKLFERFEQLTSHYPKIYSTFTEVGDYAVSKRDSRLTRAEMDDGKVHCVLRGETLCATKMYVFREKGNTITLNLEEVPKFEGQIEIVFEA